MSDQSSPDSEEEFFVLEGKSKEVKVDTNTFELILKWGGGVVICAAFITLGLIAYTGVKQIPWIKDELSKVPFPVQGDQVCLAKVSSGWVTVAVDPRVDTMPSNNYYPVSTITLDKKSTSGKLRLFYANHEGKFVGDALTVSHTDGKFESGESIQFKGSSGYESDSDFNAYFSGYINPWYLVIYEGASDSNTLSQFKELTRIELQIRVLEDKPSPAS